MNRLRPDFQKTREQIFWAEMAPPDHLVQFYANEDLFLDTLEGFVGGGLRAGDGVVVILTGPHAKALKIRLNEFWVDSAQLEKQFICLDAEETLARFMRDDWPDEELFKQVVTELLQKAGKDGRRVRAFGEMVALLWMAGHNGATVRLEHLWHEFCKEESFSLFCAYPKSGFTQAASVSIQDICAAHSKIIDGVQW